MAVKISPSSQKFSFHEEHSDNSYNYVESRRTKSSSSQEQSDKVRCSEGRRVDNARLLQGEKIGKCDGFKGCASKHAPSKALLPLPPYPSVYTLL